MIVRELESGEDDDKEERERMTQAENGIVGEKGSEKIAQGEGGWRMA